MLRVIRQDKAKITSKDRATLKFQSWVIVNQDNVPILTSYGQFESYSLREAAQRQADYLNFIESIFCPK